MGLWPVGRAKQLCVGGLFRQASGRSKKSNQDNKSGGKLKASRRSSFADACALFKGAG